MNSSGPNGRAYSTKVILEVPEPASMLLLSTGVLGLALTHVVRRRARFDGRV